uniref:Uncharacterized protein n=1 Tax=Setaria digitata TaxID=48799 RepID=A0A915PN64_9BILA
MTESGVSPKLANLTVTTTAAALPPPPSETVEAGTVAGSATDPDHHSTPSMPLLNEINEHILKLCTATRTAAAAATALTASPTVSSATVTQDPSSALPLHVPVVGGNGCYSGPSSGTPLISPQLQSLLALQFVTSQLPLTESYRLPILTTPSHVISDIRWKSIYEAQVFSTAPIIDNDKQNTDMKQHAVVTNAGFTSKGIPASSAINLDTPPCTTSKTGMSLERLLDQTLKEPVLSVAKLLVTEFRREKELLLNQNGQLRRENALLRSALASSNVLVGLKGLTRGNVPIS